MSYPPPAAAAPVYGAHPGYGAAPQGAHPGYGGAPPGYAPPGYGPPQVAPQPGYAAAPPGYGGGERAAAVAAPSGPPVQQSAPMYFTSPSMEAAGKGASAQQGQASYNEQDEFHDPQGKYKLVMKGAYAAVECAVVPGDSIKAEAGAMVTMSNNVDIEAKIEGSAGDAFVRCCCAGESLFVSHFTLKPGMGQRGDLLLAPAVPGDIMLLHLNGQHPWAIQKASYMASDASVAVRAKVQGLAAGCCSGEGFFILRAEGQGRLLLNSYGGIIRYELKPGEVRKIDNGFLVAWSEHLKYTIGKASKSLVSSFLSGEGFVCTFTGPGVIYVQTRSIIGLASALAPHITTKGGGGGGGADLGGVGF